LKLEGKKKAVMSSNSFFGGKIVSPKKKKNWLIVGQGEGKNKWTNNVSNLLF